MMTDQFHLAKKVGDLREGMGGLKRLFLSRIQGFGTESPADDVHEKHLPVTLMQDDLVECGEEPSLCFWHFKKRISQSGFQVHARRLFQTDAQKTDRSMLSEEIEAVE